MGNDNILNSDETFEKIASMSDDKQTNYMLQRMINDYLATLKLPSTEEILKNVEVVVEDEVDSSKINIGCKVKILDVEYNEEMEYKIVGSSEANSLKGKISNESPVGKALIGHKKGDTVTVETQMGDAKYKILAIERSN